MFIFIMLLMITLVACFVHFFISFSQFKKHNKKRTKYITTIGIWVCCSLVVLYTLSLPFETTVLFTICSMLSVFVGTVISFCMVSIVEINMLEQKEAAEGKETEEEEELAFEW